MRRVRNAAMEFATWGPKAWRSRWRRAIWLRDARPMLMEDAAAPAGTTCSAPSHPSTRTLVPRASPLCKNLR